MMHKMLLFLLLWRKTNADADHWEPGSSDAQLEDSFDEAPLEEELRVQELPQRIEALIEKYGEENLKAMEEDAEGEEELLAPDGHGEVDDVDDTQDGEGELFASDGDDLEAVEQVTAALSEDLGGDEALSEDLEGDEALSEDLEGVEPERRRLGAVVRDCRNALAGYFCQICKDHPGDSCMDKSGYCGFCGGNACLTRPKYESWGGRIVPSNVCIYGLDTPTDGFQHMVKGCVNGHNIVKYHNKSVAECAKLCHDRADCKAFEYGVAHGGSGGYKPRDCQLQSSANFNGCNGAYYNLDLYIKEIKEEGVTYCAATLDGVLKVTNDLNEARRSMPKSGNRLIVDMNNGVVGDVTKMQNSWSGGSMYWWSWHTIRAMYKHCEDYAKVVRPVEVPDHVAYIGCYVDNSSRDLDEFKGSGKSHADCAALCKGYKFFSMQAGSYCYCGDRYATADVYAQRPDAECGDDRIGGHWRNAIFRQDKTKGGRFTVAFVSDIEVHYRSFHAHHAKRILMYIRDIKNKNFKFDRHNDRIDTKLVVHGGDISQDENPKAHEDWRTVWNVVPDKGIPLISTFGNHDWKPRGNNKYNEDTLAFVKKTFESAASVSRDFKYERFARNSSYIGQDNYWAEFRGLQLGVFGPFVMDKAYKASGKEEAWSYGPANKLRAKLDTTKPTMFVSHAPLTTRTGTEEPVRREKWQVDWMTDMIDGFPLGSNHFAGHTHRAFVRPHNNGRWRDFTAPYPHWYGWSKDKFPNRCGEKPSKLTDSWKKCNYNCADCKGCTTTYDRCDNQNMPIRPGFLAILVDPEIGILEVKELSLENADVEKGGLKRGDYCHVIQCKRDCPDNGNNFEWWYDRHPHGFRCGASPKWGDGTLCAIGTSCNQCKNRAHWWYDKQPNGYYCGTPRKWGDGTYCMQGTSCNQCKNRSTWWYGKHPNGYYCGKERCWGKGTKCAAGTSCNACCHGSKIEWWGWFTATAVRVCK